MAMVNYWVPSTKISRSSNRRNRATNSTQKGNIMTRNANSTACMPILVGSVSTTSATKYVGSHTRRTGSASSTTNTPTSTPRQL